MKKALTQTIIVFVAVNLMMASSTLAQNVAEEESQPASKEAIVAEKEIELERKKAEIAAKVAQREAVIAAEVQQQVELVQQQVELVQKQVEVMMPEIGVAIPRVSISAWQHSGGGAVLVIPATELKVEDLAAITEDMTVLSRIFDTKLSQAQLTTGRGSGFGGFDPFFGRGSGAIEAIYLEGYGALFLMKVNILLTPTPEAPEEKETEEEDTDPLWTQMRQEMYAPQEVRRSRTGDRPEEKYDAEKVEDLKETLIKTLKHAANIRALKPDESVILTVTGKASQSGQLVTRLYSSGHSRHIATEPGVSPTVLTIRAKKSDIDAFAKGQYDFDQFRQKTQLLSYSYLGENVGGPSRSSPTNVMYGGRSSGSSRSSSRSRPR